VPTTREPGDESDRPSSRDPVERAGRPKLSAAARASRQARRWQGAHCATNWCAPR